MNKSSVQQSSEERPAPQFGDAEEQKLTRLFGKWREAAGLGATQERQFALLLKEFVRSRAVEALEADAFIRLVQPLAGETALSEDERHFLVRRVKLLKMRELTKEEKDELAALFERYRMRLWSKLRRMIGATLEAWFEPDEVLDEAYIRAETRWSARPEDSHDYVWLYGIVHEQFCDMYRKLHADQRDLKRKVRIPDNSAAEIALELWESQTGASTIAERKELVSRLRGFLERNLTPADLEIFSMRVFDRLEYPEIVAELIRRTDGENDRAADYQRILAELDSRPQEGDHSGRGNGNDANKRRADAIRKRFTRAIRKLTGAIITEFPELLDALPSLKSDKV